jgi:DnaJ-class molecular chaperone
MVKEICPICRGNGYITQASSTKTIQQCERCNSQGEVMIDESRMKSLKVERELLAVSHIRRLEKEIDELIKQKTYVQEELEKMKKEESKV